MTNINTINTADEKPYSIDRSVLATVKKRFLQFNQQRLERTLSNLTPRQQLFLELVPLLFHTNHPVLPGYISSDASCGIINFKPDQGLLRAAKQLSKSFRYKKLVNHTPVIRAIFLMGSIGTIGQSRSSDLDFWVCHDPELSNTQLRQLQQRCDGIQAWAKTLGLSVCFFLMNADDFRAGKAVALSEESSGSTQHKLLLDEFYRSAIHLAGQYPLWWFVHPDAEVHYQDYCRNLLNKRFLRAADVIDLGGLEHIPSQEFISAATWQLYKAIEAPYKSLLKLQLLEVYARRQHEGEILALKLKQAIYNNQLSADNLDPYLLLFHSLSHHLQQENLDQRLELIRRSFYFKVNKPLSKAPMTSPASWQREMLTDLVSHWQWPRDQIEQLDERHNWKAPQVMQEKRLLISELLNGYRFLNEYTQSQYAKSNDHLNQDVAILGRKLYAAFERKSGKVEMINPGISRDISEEYLTFYPQKNGNGIEEWHVSTCKKHEDMNPSLRLRSCASLLELVTWCYCNNILTKRSQATVMHKGSGRSLAPLHQALQQWLDIGGKKESRKETRLDFSKRPVPLQLLIVINELTDAGELQLSTEYPSANPLSAGSNNINLLKDIHLICHNSWGEIVVHSHDEKPLENFVRQLFNLFANSDSMAHCDVHFYCSQGNHSNSLKLRLEQIMRQVNNTLIQLESGQQGQYIISASDRLICFDKRGSQLHIESLYSEADLLHKLSQPRDQYTAIHIDPLSLNAGTTAAIFRTAITEAIQVFYLVQGERAEVFILDERNTLTRYQAPFRDEQSLLRPLHRFIRSVINRLQLNCDSTDHFGIYPVEFYELQAQEWGHSHAPHYSAKRAHVTTELQNLQFFNMQAIAEAGTCELSNFSIYCNQQQFNPAQCGDKLFHQVARQVLSMRHHGERYPCYLTDLDLGDNPESLVGDKPLQTAHFMMVKNRLEQLLNQALQEI